MKWMHIHIEGQVQGVGFRPFVYKLAHWLDLRGWVRNNVDGVHIEAGGTAEQLELFLYLLKDDAPAEARITKISSKEIEERDFHQFKIKESNSSGTPNLLITPDLGLCEHCRKEINDPQNHRYHYPFTTCTHCGPRYSILKSLPYDRHTTSMEKFKMCVQCEHEYHNPNDRRYFSQTNSCPDCSIQITLVNHTGKKLTDSWDDALPILVRSLEHGKTIAIKGVGGYLLLTDAINSEAIKTLRERKHRPFKPFALMYPDIESLREDTELLEEEENAFLSVTSPIVLVKVKPNPRSNICTDLIAPGLDTIGVMQPYTAMFDLLMKAWKKPLIATSGNMSGSPILYRDDEAFESLREVADMFLMNNRDIQLAQDDSVIRFSAINQKKIILRRSRGLAPTYLNTSGPASVLAMGADLKSSFGLQANSRTYISQYLGDLESYQSQEYYRHAQDHLIRLVKTKPERVVVDMHPQYYSTELGHELAKKLDVPVVSLQHHEAHAWSVLAENDLIDIDESVLCVVWDGTGYGHDHNVWGGEFFTYEKYELKRVSHIDYFPMWMSDTMAKEPRLSALFLCGDLAHAEKILKPKFSDQEWNYYSKMIATEPPRYTSSVGRLFDAVASLLGVCDRNTFEGQAALYLETLAATTTTASRYPVQWKGSTLDVKKLTEHILQDISHKRSSACIAYKFHTYLADVVFDIAFKLGMKKIAFSGGVFQNALLVDLIINRFNGQDQQLLFHHELSPNDENISFGQLTFAKVADQSKKYLLSELVNNLQ
jgi:hydrogenase maturation protein HypF